MFLTTTKMCINYQTFWDLKWVTLRGVYKQCLCMGGCSGWPAKFKKQIPVFFQYISSIAADFPVEFFISSTMVRENFVFSYHLSPRIHQEAYKYKDQ